MGNTSDDKAREERRRRERKARIRSQITTLQSNVDTLKAELDKVNKKLDLLYRLKRELSASYKALRDKLGRNKKKLSNIYKFAASNQIVKGYHSEMNEIVAGKNAKAKMDALEQKVNEVKAKIEQLEKKAESLTAQIKEKERQISSLWSTYRSI